MNLKESMSTVNRDQELGELQATVRSHAKILDKMPEALVRIEAKLEQQAARQARQNESNAREHSDLMVKVTRVEEKVDGLTDDRDYLKAKLEKLEAALKNSNESMERRLARTSSQKWLLRAIIMVLVGLWSWYLSDQVQSKTKVAAGSAQELKDFQDNAVPAPIATPAIVGHGRGRK